ncbi:hypothetical protein ACFOGG_15075 [Brenneria rubrifaciens]
MFTSYSVPCRHLPTGVLLRQLGDHPLLGNKQVGVATRRILSELAAA